VSTSTVPNGRARRRGRLSRERIVAAAIGVADAEGIGAVSMRRLGQELGVDPMSLYRHVGGKDELLGSMTDAVVAQIEPVTEAGGWRAAARATILAARATMVRHPWTAEVIKERPAPTPAELRYLETLIGILRDGGFGLELTHHAIHVLGSRVLGFSQDLYDDSGDTPPEEAAAQVRALEATHPRLAELAAAVTHDGALGGCDDDDEFVFSLDLMLEGLDGRRAHQADATARRR
jgi:AcrR family transcriptional regulator